MTPAASPFERDLLTHLPRVRAKALVLTRSNHADADDLVQETVLHALRAQDSFALGTDMGAWLSTLCHHRFISGLRSGRHKREHVELDDAISHRRLVTRPAQEDAVTLREVAAMIRRMPPLRRHALAIAFDGAGFDRGADATGIASGTIKSRCHRARLALREAFA